MASQADLKRAYEIATGTLEDIRTRRTLDVELIAQRLAEIQTLIVGAPPDISPDTKFHDQAVWVATPSGDEDGPFCPSCWADKKLRRPTIIDVDRGLVELSCGEHPHEYRFRVSEKLFREEDLRSYREIVGGA
jgi:hypothetical protein